MSDNGWQDAATTAWFAWESYRHASTPIDQAYALAKLNDAMGDLVTWLPGWNYETGELEQESDDEVDRDAITFQLSDAWFICTECGRKAEEGRTSTYMRWGDKTYCDECKAAR